ncbi:MAG: hypothetical protein AB7K68_10245 [Bacteriovoracia bacterium]
MNWTKCSLLVTLAIATILVVGCGDQQDKRLSNADVACLKLMQAGQPCAGAAGSGGTVTATATSTVTVTNTTTVQ